MRGIRFWGRNFLECLGLSLGIALVMNLFLGFGDINIGGQGIGGVLLEELPMLPFQLIAAGAIVIMMVTASYFQLYFSILLSMNSTRKAIAGSIWLTTALVVLALLAAAGVIWKLLPGEAAEAGMRILPLLGGGLFLESAAIIVIAVVAVRWKKAGVTILTICALVCGGCAGAWMVLRKEALEVLLRLSFHFYPVFAAGVVLYLMAGIFLRISTKKLEVRL